MINTETNHATSCMDFIRSMSKRYHSMANAPEEVTRSDMRQRKSSSEIEMLTNEAIRHIESGSSVYAAAKKVGVKYTTLFRRIKEMETSK